jgi:mono/diheme cytochrome c family protein
MTAGVVLTVLMFLAFPAYRLFEPGSRAEARETQRESLIAQGAELFASSCASCHGISGEGIDAPALNSQQFLTSATNEQISGLIAHGIPGSGMASYSIDFGGFLTSEQIEAITVFLRSLEEDAPDRPDWRTLSGDGGHDEDEPADAHDEGEPADAHDEGEPADAHDEEEPADAHDEEEPADAHDEEEPADAHDEEAGQEIFNAEETFNDTCARCHGVDLAGGTGPALGPTAHSLGEPDEHLIEAITFGRDEMPAFGDELSEEQIQAIVDYIREVQAG